MSVQSTLGRHKRQLPAKQCTSEKPTFFQNVRSALLSRRDKISSWRVGTSVQWHRTRLESVSVSSDLWHVCVSDSDISTFEISTESLKHRFRWKTFFRHFSVPPQINQVLELIFSLTGSRNFCNGAILLFDWWMWLAAASMHHFNASVDFPNHYSNMEPSMKDEDATCV